MKYATQKIRKGGEQCGVCAAEFEIWLNNSRLPEERREKISQHLLSYCPICGKTDEKN